MRSFMLIAIGVVACASLPLTMAQQNNTQLQENSSGSAAGVHMNQSASAGASASRSSGNAKAGGSAASSLEAGNGPARVSTEGSGNTSSQAAMRPVTGQLEGKLDSKTAKPGDRVVLKTEKKMKTADGTVIPKGSRLVGHVTEVQAHEKGHAESEMGLEFDRAELKGGQTMAIHSMIESVRPNASALADSSMANDDAFDTPIGGGGGAVRGSALGGGRAGGGGLVGGTVGGAAQATGRVGSDLGSNLGSAAGGAVRTTGNLSGDAGSSLAHGVGGAASGAGSLGARATGIPGVMLNGDATGSASGTLTAANKNVHLDSGTEMVLGVAAAQ